MKYTSIFWVQCQLSFSWSVALCVYPFIWYVPGSHIYVFLRQPNGTGAPATSKAVKTGGDASAYTAQATFAINNQWASLPAFHQEVLKAILSHPAADDGVDVTAIAKVVGGEASHLRYIRHLRYYWKTYVGLLARRWIACSMADTSTRHRTSRISQSLNKFNLLCYVYMSLMICILHHCGTVYPS